MNTKQISHDDIRQMRIGADWWESPTGGIAEYADDSPEELARLADRCRSVADRVEQALNEGDVERADEISHEWPEEAGPWK
jgi:hypothetical protein